MNWKAFVAILLVLSGFGASGYLYLENDGLREDVASRDVAIDGLHQNISELERVRDNLTQEVESLDSRIAELDDELANATSVLAEVMSENAGLSYQIIELEYEVDSLRDTKTSLEESLSSKQVAYTRLESNYDVLQDDFIDLELTYRIEKELRIGNSLECYYDSLREELGPTGSEYWWYTPSESVWQIEVDFAANLAQHDLWRICWPDLETDYEAVVGEYSYETAYGTLSAIIGHIDFSSIDSHVDKISKVLNFLSEHIHYEYDVNDVFLAPVETLGFKSGDCDDYSILASALLECVEVESAIGFFRNDLDQYHAMVLVHLDDIGDYGCYYYEDLTGHGLTEGRWIIIEPQTTIGDQYTEWVEQWTLLAACELVD